ncbi:MAG: acyltransferase [Thermoanaerobaculia bacterium]
MIRAVATILLLFLNLLAWGIPVTLLGIVKLFVPGRAWRRRIRMLLTELGDRWAGANNIILDRAVRTRWNVEGVEGLRADGHYLILCNHVSWLDIFVLQRTFHRRVAFIRFFLKRELIWFPIVGLASWALDFPFMRRYTPEYLERHPEKRGLDLEATRRACRRYRGIPVAILNFMEGTRYTPEKHARQESPYRHLLRPRFGGTAFVMASLGEQLDAIVDVTLAYPSQDVTLWEFLTNRVAWITIHVRVLEVPREFLSEPITEPGPARDAFRQWITGLWQEKDDRLNDIRTALQERHDAPVRD